MNECFFPLIQFLRAASFVKFCSTALGQVKTNLFFGRNHKFVYSAVVLRFYNNITTFFGRNYNVVSAAIKRRCFDVVITTSLQQQYNSVVQTPFNRRIFCNIVTTSSYGGMTSRLKNNYITTPSRRRVSTGKLLSPFHYGQISPWTIYCSFFVQLQQLFQLMSEVSQ